MPVPRHPFTALLLLLGLSSGPAPARDLQIEVDVLHIGGMLAPTELESLLSDERLSIEALYRPKRLIEGVTARRERTMPFGSRLHAIPRHLTLEGSQVERDGRRLRFQVPDIHPGHADYRLRHLTLRTPIAAGPGRPQPHVRIALLGEPPGPGAHETALYTRHGAFDLGLRLRYRWSDAQGAAVAAALTCDSDIRASGNGEYRFRPRHRLAGLFEFLSPVVASDPPAHPPAGRRSMRLREPFPDPVTGWQLSRNHLVQLQIDGQFVERLSVYAEQAGPGPCRRTRAYGALFAGGAAVTLQRSIHEVECGSERSRHSHSVAAHWLDDGSLAGYRTSTPEGSRTWDAFSAAAPAVCGTHAAAPATGEVQALSAELQRIREAFLRP